MGKNNYGYVLVEDEKWWNRRISKNKLGTEIHAFVRKGAVGPKEAQKILFYVKRPAKQIKGLADFLQRITGTSDELWNLYGSETVFENRDEYERFVSGRSKVTFIRFKSMKELSKPLDFNDLVTATGINRMPQGGKFLGREIVDSIASKG